MPDWGAWDNEPLLVDLLVLAGWWYAIVAGPMRERLAPGRPWPRRAAARFFAGLLLGYLAVGPPWERIGRFYLLSAQVAGDVIILYPAAGLILSGLPGWLIDGAVGASGRWWRTLLHPVTCGALFIIIQSGAFLPRVYEWTLADGGRLALHHAAMLLAGLLVWRPILGASRELPPLRFGPRMAYLFGVEVAMTGIFLFLIMPETSMYPSYDLAPRIIAGLSAENDQVLAGILLALASSFAFVGALGVAFFAWARQAHAEEPG